MFSKNLITIVYTLEAVLILEIHSIEHKIKEKYK